MSFVCSFFKCSVLLWVLRKALPNPRNTPSRLTRSLVHAGRPDSPVCWRRASRVGGRSQPARVGPGHGIGIGMIAMADGGRRAGGGSGGSEPGGAERRGRMRIA